MKFDMTLPAGYRKVVRGKMLERLAPLEATMGEGLEAGS